VQVERRTKRKTKFFIFFAETPPNFEVAGLNMVQVERRTKRKTKFFIFLPQLA